MTKGTALVLYRTVFCGAVFAILGSFWLGVHGWNANLTDDTGKVIRPLLQLVKWKVAVLICWTILPPILFWAEYFGMYRSGARDFRAAPPDFDEFKYGQDISSKVWIAVSTALLILYFGKDIRH
jgi:hypothetical protein